MSAHLGRGGRGSQIGGKNSRRYGFINAWRERVEPLRPDGPRAHPSHGLSRPTQRFNLKSLPNHQSYTGSQPLEVDGTNSNWQGGVGGCGQHVFWWRQMPAKCQDFDHGSRSIIPAVSGRTGGGIRHGHWHVCKSRHPYPAVPFAYHRYPVTAAPSCVHQPQRTVGMGIPELFAPCATGLQGLACDECVVQLPRFPCLRKLLPYLTLSYQQALERRPLLSAQRDSSPGILGQLEHPGQPCAASTHRQARWLRSAAST